MQPEQDSPLRLTAGLGTEASKPRSKRGKPGHERDSGKSIPIRNSKFRAIEAQPAAWHKQSTPKSCIDRSTIVKDAETIVSRGKVNVMIIDEPRLTAFGAKAAMSWSSCSGKPTLFGSTTATMDTFNMIRLQTNLNTRPEKFAKITKKISIDEKMISAILAPKLHRTMPYSQPTANPALSIDCSNSAAKQSKANKRLIVIANTEGNTKITKELRSKTVGNFWSLSHIKAVKTKSRISPKLEADDFETLGPKEWWEAQNKTIEQLENWAKAGESSLEPSAASTPKAEPNKRQTSNSPSELLKNIREEEEEDSDDSSSKSLTLENSQGSFDSIRQLNPNKKLRNKSPPIAMAPLSPNRDQENNQIFQKLNELKDWYMKVNAEVREVHQRLDKQSKDVNDKLQLLLDGGRQIPMQGYDHERGHQSFKPSYASMLRSSSGERLNEPGSYRRADSRLSSRSNQWQGGNEFRPRSRSASNTFGRRPTFEEEELNRGGKGAKFVIAPLNYAEKRGEVIVDQHRLTLLTFLKGVLNAEKANEQRAENMKLPDLSDKAGNIEFRHGIVSIWLDESEDSGNEISTRLSSALIKTDWNSINMPMLKLYKANDMVMKDVFNTSTKAHEPIFEAIKKKIARMYHEIDTGSWRVIKQATRKLQRNSGAALSGDSITSFTFVADRTLSTYLRTRNITYMYDEYDPSCGRSQIRLSYSGSRGEFSYKSADTPNKTFLFLIKQRTSLLRWQIEPTTRIIQAEGPMRKQRKPSVWQLKLSNEITTRRIFARNPGSGGANYPAAGKTTPQSTGLCCKHKYNKNSSNKRIKKKSKIRLLSTRHFSGNKRTRCIISKATYKRKLGPASDTTRNFNVPKELTPTVPDPYQRWRSITICHWAKSISLLNCSVEYSNREKKCVKIHRTKKKQTNKTSPRKWKVICRCTNGPATKLNVSLLPTADEDSTGTEIIQKVNQLFPEEIDNNPAAPMETDCDDDRISITMNLGEVFTSELAQMTRESPTKDTINMETNKEITNSERKTIEKEKRRAKLINDLAVVDAKLKDFREQEESAKARTTEHPKPVNSPTATSTKPENSKASRKRISVEEYKSRDDKFNYKASKKSHEIRKDRKASSTGQRKSLEIRKDRKILSTDQTIVIKTSAELVKSTATREPKTLTEYREAKKRQAYVVHENKAHSTRTTLRVEAEGNLHARSAEISTGPTYDFRGKPWPAAKTNDSPPNRGKAPRNARERIRNRDGAKAQALPWERHFIIHKDYPLKNFTLSESDSVVEKIDNHFRLVVKEMNKGRYSSAAQMPHYFKNSKLLDGRIQTLFSQKPTNGSAFIGCSLFESALADLSEEQATGTKPFPILRIVQENNLPADLRALRSAIVKIPYSDFTIKKLKEITDNQIVVNNRVKLDITNWYKSETLTSDTGTKLKILVDSRTTDLIKRHDGILKFRVGILQIKDAEISLEGSHTAMTIPSFKLIFPSHLQLEDNRARRATSCRQNYSTKSDPAKREQKTVTAGTTETKDVIKITSRHIGIGPTRSSHLPNVRRIHELNEIKKITKLNYKTYCVNKCNPKGQLSQLSQENITCVLATLASQNREETRSKLPRGMSTYRKAEARVSDTIRPNKTHQGTSDRHRISLKSVGRPKPRKPPECNACSRVESNAI